MHVDVGGAGAAACIEVVASAATVFAYRIALSGVEGDAGDAGVVRKDVLGVVEEDVGAARSAARVQVTVATDEAVASLAWGKVVGAPFVGQVVGRIGTRPDVEAGDGRAAVARAALFLVEQVDVVTARAASLVQVLVDVRPTLLLQIFYEGIEIALVFVPCDHHVGDEVRGRGREGRSEDDEQCHGCPQEGIME